MDDGIGNIVYIILLIILGVSRLLRNNQKKKQAAERAKENWQDDEHWDTETEPKTESPPTPFENLLERIEEMAMDNKKEPEPETEEVMEPEESLSSQYNKSKIARETLRTEGMKGSFKGKKQVIIEEEILGESITDAAETKNKKSVPCYDISEMLQDPNDLKKAVILSEILNKKY